MISQSSDLDPQFSIAAAPDAILTEKLIYIWGRQSIKK